MRHVTSSRNARRLVALALGVTTALTLGSAVSSTAAVRDHARVEDVLTTGSRVGRFVGMSVTASDRVFEDYGVTFSFDLGKVDLVSETCAAPNETPSPDTPSCEYDTPTGRTLTTGTFIVQPGATGSFAIRACAKAFSTGTAPADCVTRRFRIR